MRVTVSHAVRRCSRAFMRIPGPFPGGVVDPPNLQCVGDHRIGDDAAGPGHHQLPGAPVQRPGRGGVVLRMWR